MLESSMLLNIQQPFPKLENTILIPASPDKVETNTDKIRPLLFPRSGSPPVSSGAEAAGPLPLRSWATSRLTPTVPRSPG